MKQNTTRNSQKTVAKDSFEAGREFEEYVINLFNKDNFWLLDHQVSKPVQDFKHLDLNYPDLYLVFIRKRQYRFAVECKYLSRFTSKGYITWAEERHIKSYLFYQAKFNIPVFIAIGVGGKSSAPEKLFVTPLNNICQCPQVHESDLIPYKRKPTQKFFYDTVQLKLF